MKEVYLLILMQDNKIVETHYKVYTSFDFAKQMRDQLNELRIENNQNGYWSITSLELDDFKTSNDLRVENEL